MLKKGFNSPFASSAGMVFDAVASLLGICRKTTYEGQGAMMLEDMAGRQRGIESEGQRVKAYPVAVARERWFKYV